MATRMPSGAFLSALNWDSHFQSVAHHFSNMITSQPNYFREMTRLLLLFALVTSVGTLVPTVMISLTALKALDFRNLSPVL